MGRALNKVPVPAKTIGALAAAATAAAVGALWVRHRARKAERDNPPVGRFVKVDGVPLHYVDKGEGPAVVLLHGNAVLLQDFIASGLIDRLAERHRVIAFDRPGFGFSGRPRDRLWTAQAQAAVIQQALTQVGVKRPVVLGHSWGTLVALNMAAGDAADLRGLVLVSGYYYPTVRADVALAAPAALPILGDVLRYTVSPLSGRLLFRRTVQIMFAPAPVPDDFFESVAREMVLRPVQIRAEAEDAAFMIPAAAQLSARYSDLKMPVSIFAGADDKVIDPEANSVRLHRAIPQSTLLVAPGAGHMVHYAISARIADTIEGMSAWPDGGLSDSDAAVGETSGTAESPPVTPAQA
ncbi:alpha/beta hydrolase fold protein [Caballeronia temeraria]|uniref:Alpha/beta hydrolase fold protein n=1 Tax=Caballeronia temeraria TaxID=1777137 RepID=A0A158DYF6_9BURK|nr:alpha/beta hydrolase [Caballeronia temeraria]SAK99226.1 alpha/beta hydrolase fold protein [Caballeronia temeraria]